MEGVVIDHLLFRFTISQSFREIFANKIWHLKLCAQLVFGGS